MKNKTTYHREGDYLIPDLVVENNEKVVLGKYGRARLNYIKNHKRGLYAELMMTGELSKHLTEIDKTANERLDVFTINGTKGKISFSLDGGGDIKLNVLGNKKIITFDEPYIYEKNMVDSIVNELLNKKYNPDICHGKDALETYSIIDLVLSEFYNGRDREFWKNQ